jgi:Zn-finger nucleic acid-binding protein
MKCPVCDVTLSISSREGVEIDFCPQCRGVWLDRGELDKIIERARPGLAVATDAGWSDPVDRRHHRDWDDHEYRRRRKRRSFLEDLFDFD